MPKASGIMISATRNGDQPSAAGQRHQDRTKQHDHVAMGDIDEAHDAERERQAQREQRIEAADQDALDDEVEGTSRHHRSRPEIMLHDPTRGWRRPAARQRHLAFEQAIEAVGDRERTGNVLLDHDDTATPRSRPGDDLVELVDNSGASPRLISSQSRRRGLASSARPSATICCWPPDSSRARCRAAR